MSRKYIGVDLGAWYGGKTSIAILEEIDGNTKPTLKKIIREFSDDNKTQCIYHGENQINGEYIFEDDLIDKLKKSNKQIMNIKNWNSLISPEDKNERLKKYILKHNEEADKMVVGIDAPFAIPYYLCNLLKDGDNRETLYNPDNEEYRISGELTNQFIYDNSARFVYQHTGEKVLAPAGDKIGKITARMIHMVNKYKDELNIIKTPHLDIQSKKLSTIEVYPRATLKMLLKGEIDKKKKDIPPYKGDKWNDKKSYMIDCLSICINNPKEQLLNQIITDDDYDAIICALTAYLVSHKDYGYEKPKEEDLDKFTNSFIYIPKNLKSLCFSEI